jgi:hypothetical protein
VAASKIAESRVLRFLSRSYDKNFYLCTAQSSTAATLIFYAFSCVPMPLEEDTNAMLPYKCNPQLCLDLVFTSEHIVDVGQIVCAWSDGFDLTKRAEILLEVGLLSE